MSFMLKSAVCQEVRKWHASQCLEAYLMLLSFCPEWDSHAVVLLNDQQYEDCSDGLSVPFAFQLGGLKSNKRGGSSQDRCQTCAILCQKVWRLQFYVISRGGWKGSWKWSPLRVPKPTVIIPSSETLSWNQLIVEQILGRRITLICPVAFSFKGISWWPFPVLSSAGLNKFLKEREKNLPSKS